MLFFLTIIADALGIAGGALMSVSLLGLNANTYLHDSYRGLVHGDIVQGLTKPLSPVSSSPPSAATSA